MAILEIEPIEAQIIKEIFELCKQGKSTRSIATAMRDNKFYLKSGKWTTDRVYKMLTNSIILEYLNMANIVENHKIY